ncbi:cytochrome P450 [Schizopora paradoxa]|uniref:Cytochrome P450 n=1 Tax=Schizopora paradoxa TaxID=27342 RepID=A0A0H2S4Q2_9AGAM|nr:cytochrome P450 [Schizopora paradoxa]
MLEDPVVPLVAVGSLAALVAGRALVDRVRGVKTLPYPPGPTPLPFVGNAHQISEHEVYRLFASWGEKYGGISSFRIFGKQFVLLNELKAVTALLEHRNALYSQRPDMAMLKLCGREENAIVFQKYGQNLKDARKLVNVWIGKSATDRLAPQITATSHKYMGTLLENPEGFLVNARFMLGAMVLKMTYGIDAKSKDDPYIYLSERMQRLTTEAVKPGHWLVDSFPILAKMPTWMPGTGLSWAAETKRQIDEAVHATFDFTRQAVINGEAEHSWTAEEILDKEGNIKTGEEAEKLATTSAAVYAGSIDTTVAVTSLFFLLMARNPDIQRRAQEEVDRVVGTDRLPEMSDKESLPFIQRIIKETLRFAPVAPVVVHSLDEDDVYEGYLIPKGTSVLANIWAILHNPEMYKDPEVFNPDRYLDTPGRPAEPDHSHAVFGFGRRACPGSHFALANLTMNIATILSAFNVKPIKNADGVEVPPEIDIIDGHTRGVRPFKCVIEPRTPEKAQLIREAARAANDFSY